MYRQVTRRRDENEINFIIRSEVVSVELISILWSNHSYVLSQFLLIMIFMGQYPLFGSNFILTISDSRLICLLFP